MAERARAYEQKLRRDLGVTALAREQAARIGTVVLRGPCSGVDYAALDWTAVDAPLAKLIGVYERELQPLLEAATRAQPSVFVDIGAAEGYYAVGVARRCPHAAVHAFELAPSARAACRTLARANGVESRLVMHGAATVARLSALPLDGALVLCDCEGCEQALFRPALAAHLGRTHLIIEVHEHLQPGVGARLQECFAATHVPTELRAGAPRDSALAPELLDLGDRERDLALSEGRDEARWLALAPRRGPRFW